MTARPAWSSRAWLGQPHPAFVRAVQSLLRASEGMNADGWELSVRLTPQGVSWQRLLVGWKTAGVSLARWSSLTREWGMPDTLAQVWQAQSVQAKGMLLAVEGLADGGIDRRAYWQFDHDQPAMRGFKWQEGQPQVWRQTDYHRVALDWTSVQAALASTSAHTSQVTALQQAQSAAADILAIAAQRWETHARTIHQAPFEVLAATESVAGDLTPRGSSCLRLIDLELGADLVDAPMRRLLQQWQLASHGAALRNVLTHRPLSWLAVGQDRQGQPFLTIYAQASVHDAWQWTASGAGR